LSEAHLEGAKLFEPTLTKSDISRAHLEGAGLYGAWLGQANLTSTHLERVDLTNAHLEGAEFRDARLEQADLSYANLDESDLRRAWVDSKTVLTGVTLDKNTRLGDIHWSGVGSVDLTSITWDRVRRLGDERGVGPRSHAYYVEFGSRSLADPYEDVVRAYRQVASQRRAQGINEVADRFLYRSQLWRRRVLRRKGLRGWGAALGSWFLDLISGYGYRPMRSLIAYIVVILGFAATYFALGGANGQPLSWNEALVVSMTAFHGRGFFAAVFQPGDLQAAVAAVEAFIGLLIEIVFIATFTQRFFAR
jgi:hypothetical protein